MEYFHVKGINEFFLYKNITLYPCSKKYSAHNEPLNPVEKFSIDLTVFFSRGTFYNPIYVIIWNKHCNQLRLFHHSLPKLSSNFHHFKSNIKFFLLLGMNPFLFIIVSLSPVIKRLNLSNFQDPWNFNWFTINFIFL